MTTKPPVTGRVKSIKSKFENLNSLEPLDISVANLKNVQKPDVPKFRRSSTSFDLFERSPASVATDSRKYFGNLKKSNEIHRQASDSVLFKSTAGQRNFQLNSTAKPLNEIKENVEVCLLSRHTSDPIKRGSIKRSPAFRVGEKYQNKKTNKISPASSPLPASVPEEFNDKFEKLLKRCVVDQDFDKFNQPGITDTLKAALKQPLPTGPPPKKPPRSFIESPKDELSNPLFKFEEKPEEFTNNELKSKINFLESNLKLKSEDSKIHDKKSLKSNASTHSLLNCLSCTSPIYDAVVNNSKSQNDLEHLMKSSNPAEHIYMEPFSHLRNHPPVADHHKQQLPIPDIISSVQQKGQQHIHHNDSRMDSCSCHEDSGTAEGNGDLHYLCTSIDNSIKSDPDTMSNDSDTTNPISLTNQYDEINILVNAAFGTTSGDNMAANSLQTAPASSLQKSASAVKLSRSLTEKRKNYVQRISLKTGDNVQAYGTLHRTFKSPVLKTFSFDDSDSDDDEKQGIIENLLEKSESTSDRINKYKQLVETTNSKVVYRQKSMVKCKQDDAQRIEAIAEQQTNDINSNKLFQLCLLVGYNISNGLAYIKSKYPNDQNVPPNIEQLVFPSKNVLQQGRESQDYSLILTDLCGNRIYGYCRRVLPERCEICLPLAYCLISTIKAPGFYFKILREIESRHGQTDFESNFLLKSLESQNIPEAGKYLHIKLPHLISQRTKPIFMSNHKISPKRLSLEVNPKWLTESAAQAAFHDSDSSDRSGSSKRSGLKSLVQEFEEKKQEKLPFDLGLINRSLIGSQRTIKVDEILIRRPHDVRLESTELSDLYRGLGADLLINVFATLLLERKVLLFSKNISLLSSCILGLQTILYPFQWQYTLVTILPQNLVEICQAPFPVLAGMLEPITVEIEDGIIVDLDAKQIMQKCGDEQTILPQSLRDSLMVSLDMVDLLDQGKMLSSVLIAEAFLRFFIELFASYKQRQFEKEAFIQSHTSQSIRLFLEWFVETAMFRHFVNTKYSVGRTDCEQLEAFTEDYALFDARLLEKSENKTKINNNIEIIMKNCRIINKKAKTFKDRFKDFLHNNN